jgi:hypothetical protein
MSNEHKSESGAAVGCGAVLACPFCGAPGKIYTDGDGPMSGRAVVCTCCRARTVVSLLTRDYGIEQWQTRQANCD